MYVQGIGADVGLNESGGKHMLPFSKSASSLHESLQGTEEQQRHC
jgi:hypothetical protein